MNFKTFINDKDNQFKMLHFVSCLNQEEIDDYDIHIKDDGLIISSNIECDHEYIISYDPIESPGTFSCIYRYPELDDYMELTGNIIEKREDSPLKKIDNQNRD